MNGQTLNEVAEHKDLGITISSNLKVANHCQHACSKDNRMLGLIKRTVKHKNISVMVQLYKSLVRPHLEYCSPACNPHYSKDKAMLERVQHQFTTYGTSRLLLTAAHVGTPRSLLIVIATLMQDCAFSDCVLSTAGTVCLKK